MSSVNPGDKLLQEAVKRLESGDTSGAQELLNQLLTHYPGHPEGLMRRGFLKMKLYDVEGALGDWEEAISRDSALAKKFDTPELRASVESALQQIKSVSIDPTSAQYYILMGRAYAVFGRLALSLQAYTSALRISPEEIQAGLGSSGIYIKLGQIDQALQVLQKMLELHPNSALLCSRVGFIYLQLNSTAQAVRFLERACSLNPADWNSHLALAEVLIKQGRHEAAIARYQQTLQLEPNCSPALVGMAECCKELYRFEEAISYYQKAKAADPKDFKAVCQLGVLCIQLGGLDLGIESLQRARELNPTDVEVYSNLAKAYQQKGDLGTAAEFYAKTVTLNPRDYFAAYNLGLIYRSQGRIDEAATAFGTAASLRPNDSQYQYQLARAAIELGRAHDALEAARKAVSLNPHNKEIQLVYARASIFSKLYNEALEASKAALHIDPQNLEAVLYLAQAQLELGQTAEAEAGFQNALRLAPMHSQALRGLGRVHLRAGNAQKSAEYLQQAVEVEPDDPAGINDLGLLYLSARQPERIYDSIESVLKRRNSDGRLTGAFLTHWLNFLQDKGVYEVGTQLFDRYADRFADPGKLATRQLRWFLDWCDVFRGKGDFGAAQTAMQRLLKAQPGCPEALARLADIENQLQQKPPAPEPQPVESFIEEFPTVAPKPEVAAIPDDDLFAVPDAVQAAPLDQPAPTLPPAPAPAPAPVEPAEAPSQRHMVEQLQGCENRNETWLQLSQRFLEFGLQLEKAGWLKEATLILWDAYSLPDCDESLQLHSHRILQNWSNRLEQEGKIEDSRQVRLLLGIETPPAPAVPPLPRRLTSSDSPRALLEPPPPMDWNEPPEVSPGHAGPADDFVAAPPPPPPLAEPPSVEPEPAPAVRGEDIASWMKSFNENDGSAPAPRSALGAPREDSVAPRAASPEPPPVEAPKPAPPPPPPPPPLPPPPPEDTGPASPPEFEVHLSGTEDQASLIHLIKRHPEHKGVRSALYRTFADDMASLVRVFRDLVQEDPDEVYHVLNLARAFAYSGSDSMAILQFRKYVKLEATSEGYRELGEAYERMGKSELAAQAFRKAEELRAEEELDN